MSDENTTIDDEFIPEDGEGFTGTQKDVARALREKLKKAVEEKQQYLDGWQRAKADLINLRKRDEEDKKEFIKFANEGLVSDIIPVLDSFELAMANKAAWEKIDANWRKGVEHIYSQLLNALESNGLKSVMPLGEKFDPARDSAVETVPVTDKHQDHKVVEVLQRGYSLNGRLVRSPQVKVGEYKPE